MEKIVIHLNSEYLVRVLLLPLNLEAFHKSIISMVTENSGDDSKQQSYVFIQGVHGQDILLPFCHFAVEVISKVAVLSVSPGEFFTN